MQKKKEKKKKDPFLRLHTAVRAGRTCSPPLGRTLSKTLGHGPASSDSAPENGLGQDSVCARVYWGCSFLRSVSCWAISTFSPIREYISSLQVKKTTSALFSSFSNHSLTFFFSKCILLQLP